jgi:uncharacterized protein YlxW (UPF0749 family)
MTAKDNAYNIFAATTTAIITLLLLGANLSVMAAAGTLPGGTEVLGPGIALTVQDPGTRMSWETLLDLVQELRDGGAESVAVNDTRLVASSWFGPADGGVVVDEEVVVPPYRFEAIGDPQGLREALGIPGGALSLIEAQPGVGITIEEAERLRLPALQRPTTFRYARPAP